MSLSTPAASVSPISSTKSASPDNTTDSITIVLGIISAVLTLVSVIVAFLQYRMQAQKRLDMERDGQVIEMNLPRPAREGTPPSQAHPHWFTCTFLLVYDVVPIRQPLPRR